MPAAVTRGGWVTFEHESGPTVSMSQQGGRRLRFRRALGLMREAVSVSGLLFDARRYGPENWAHTLLYLLPLAYLARKHVEHEVTVLLPTSVGKHISRAFEVFGFSTLNVDRDIRGEFINWDIDDFDTMNSMRADILPSMTEDFVRQNPKPENGSPAKIFVSRKDKRKLKNESEIASFLSDQGYQIVYPETMTVEEQFWLFLRASRIVGISGAGLAPIGLCNQSESCDLELIELLPAGMMNNWFRVICDQINARCVGVRGVIEPKNVSVPIDQMKTYYRHVMDDFTIDQGALELALRLVSEVAPRHRLSRHFD